MINVLLGAEAYGERAAGGDEARTWVAQAKAQSQADGDGENEDEVSAKGLGFPVKNYAVGEDVTGGNRRSC